MYRFTGWACPSFADVIAFDLRCLGFWHQISLILPEAQIPVTVCDQGHKRGANSLAVEIATKNTDLQRTKVSVDRAGCESSCRRPQDCRAEG